MTPTLRSVALAIALAGVAGMASRSVAAGSEPVPTSVTAGSVTLRSARITLPSSDRMYPDGPHADMVNANCLACHSAGMVLTQPRLGRAEWQGEVAKMIKVYKAPVEPADAALIVDYLAQLKPGS